MKLSEKNTIIQTRDKHYFIKQKECGFVTIVDLGYHEGSFEKSISKIFNNYIVYCVDANKQFSGISDNSQFDNFLLSNQSFIEKQFYLNLNNPEASSKYFISDKKNYCLVQTITLKDYYNYKKIDKVDILKIDIEGSEFDILDNDTINFLSKNSCLINNKLFTEEEDEIIFMEVKTGNSQLTATQRKVRDLIEQKKVKWEVLRVK